MNHEQYSRALLVGPSTYVEKNATIRFLSEHGQFIAPPAIYHFGDSTIEYALHGVLDPELYFECGQLAVFRVVARNDLRLSRDLEQIIKKFPLLRRKPDTAETWAEIHRLISQPRA